MVLDRERWLQEFAPPEAAVIDFVHLRVRVTRLDGFDILQHLLVSVGCREFRTTGGEVLMRGDELMEEILQSLQIPLAQRQTRDTPHQLTIRQIVVRTTNCCKGDKLLYVPTRSCRETAEASAS